MGLFSSSDLKGLATGLFSQYTGIQLAPSGTVPVQATLPATRTGTPAQDPIVQNGLRTAPGTGSSLFSGNAITPILIVVGSIVAVAAIVMLARR